MRGQDEDFILKINIRAGEECGDISALKRLDYEIATDTTVDA